MQLNRTALIALSLLCVLCAGGLGMAVRDIALQTGATATVANIAMAVAILALVGVFVVLVTTLRRADPSTGSEAPRRQT
jgi:hypothetical protein